MYNGMTQPPFYWKVKEPEKDYMLENYQRIRKLNVQNKQNREPMKAAFIPGVTKNPKYAHVTSRVGEFLRSNVERGGGGDDGSFVSSRTKLSASSSANKILPSKYGGQLQQQQQQQQQRTSHTNGTVNRRLSRSSSDLATINKKKIISTSSASAGTSSQTSLNSNPQQQRSLVNIGVEGPGNYVPRAKRKPRGLQPQDESVYNWRFNDQAINPTYNVPDPSSLLHAEKFPSVKTLHRVEYLPCDGICAEEEVQDVSDGSGRSSSRTSRGCNTEETRIIEDFQNLDLQQPSRSQSLEQFPSHPPPVKTTTNTTTTNTSTMTKRQQQRPQCFEQGWMTPDQNQEEEEEGQDHFNGGSSNYPYSRQNAQNIHKASSATTVIKSSRSREKEKQSSELPHSLGTVPKYLKQRQEEWKIQQEEEKKAADILNSAPPGHVLMDDKERVETLATLKKNYNDLINELNRVPIRIDTMRVRDHKIKLEQQLQKLEQAMTVFSRPRVYIKNC